MQFRRRHHVFLVFAQDALDQGALLYVTWHYGDIAALQFFRRPGEFIETQAGLAAFVRVWSMATVATVGKDRPHLTIEVYGHVARAGDAGGKQAEQGSDVLGSHQGCRHSTQKPGSCRTTNKG